MHLNNSKLWAAILFLCFSHSVTLYAQHKNGNNKWEKYELKYRTFRFTLFPGLSTNGIDAKKYASKYSLNILGGYHGALENGFELGGLVNANKYYTHGVQIAGLANYSNSETAGIQLAGIGSFSRGQMQGIQLSGVGNWSVKEMQGIQVSGAFNLAGSSTQGLIFTGGINLARKDMQGLFGAGIANISGGAIEGLLFSGITNLAKSSMQGIAASGLFNYSKSFEGITVSSVNVSRELSGMQVGGANFAKEASGIQIGLINYAKSFQGLPVGLISYYNNGRTNIDTWTSETGFTNIGLKLGTNEIYNMISVGYNPLLSRDVWQVGWSIGRLHQYTHHYLYTDFSYFKINESSWTKDLNSILKYRLLFGKELMKGLKIYGGPTFNMLISKVPESSDYTFYRLIDFGAKGRDYIFWIGFSTGIELF